MDILMELIVEIIFEGALGSITEKRIPIFFRVYFRPNLYNVK